MITIWDILNKFNNEKFINANHVSWQSKQIDSPMYEVYNFLYTLDCREWNEDKAIYELQPEKEWCHVHFKERVSGQPLNPPSSHKMWNIKTDEYLSKIDPDKFSHSYPERFWPKKLLSKGIRFETSDYNDIKKLLKEDINTRQAYLPIFFNEDISAALQKERVPCTLGYYFYYDVNRNALNLNYIIRSIDMIRHVNNDLYLSYLLLKDICDYLAVSLGVIDLFAFNAHCFVNDEYTIKRRLDKYYAV